MIQETKNISVDAVNKAFEKIYKGLEKKYVRVIEKEMAKLIPSETSNVYLTAGYGEYDNTAGFNVFVSNPTNDNKSSEIRFDKIILAWLLKADIDKLPVIWDCLSRMENKKGEKYSIDGIPAFFNNETGEFYSHFTISKE